SRVEIQREKLSVFLRLKSRPEPSVMRLRLCENGICRPIRGDHDPILSSILARDPIPSPPMPLIVTGTVGIDTVYTPAGHREQVLGGSCTYFAAAASFYGPVRMVAAVGGDFPD